MRSASVSRGPAVGEHSRRAQGVAAESGELGRFRALAADVSDQRRVAAALREHVVEVAPDLVAVAQRGEVGGEIESGRTWERGRQQARLQRLGDVVLALVEPVGLGVEARTVERLRAVVRERQQESPLVLGECALARKADDEDAERAVGDPERETGDRHGFVTELLRETPGRAAGARPASRPGRARRCGPPRRRESARRD